MIKASVFLMAAITVGIAFLLGRLEQRRPQTARLGLMARGKRGLNRWVNAAALAVLITLLVMGGLHWWRVLSAG